MIRVGEETVPSLLVFPPESGPDIDLPRDFLKLLLDLLTRELFTGRHEWDTPGVILSRIGEGESSATPCVWGIRSSQPLSLSTGHSSPVQWTTYPLHCAFP